jgi:hypothetical protein
MPRGSKASRCVPRLSRLRSLLCAPSGAGVELSLAVFAHHYGTICRCLGPQALYQQARPPVSGLGPNVERKNTEKHLPAL